MFMSGKHLHKFLRAVQIKETYNFIQKKQLIKQKNVLSRPSENTGKLAHGQQNLSQETYGQVSKQY